MKTLGSHPGTADSLHFRRTLDTMIHAWVPLRSRADFPGRMNVVYKKLQFKDLLKVLLGGRTSSRGRSESGTAGRRPGKEQRAGHHSSEDVSVLRPCCSAKLHATQASGSMPPPELQTAPDRTHSSKSEHYPQRCSHYVRLPTGVLTLSQTLPTGVLTLSLTLAREILTLSQTLPMGCLN